MSSPRLRAAKSCRTGVTAFKARCLALIEEVAQGKTRRVLLTKRNRAIAAIVPVEHETAELWGAMRGSVKVARIHLSIARAFLARGFFV